MNRAPQPSQDTTARPIAEVLSPDALLAAASAVVEAIEADDAHEGGLLIRRTLLLAGILRRAIRDMQWRRNA